MTTETQSIPYAGVLNRSVPDDAPAWGARMIVTQDGHVDFVHDRQGARGDAADLMPKLDSATIVEIKDAISALLKSYTMKTREPGEFTVIDRMDLRVLADTNGSAGYCYVAAFDPMPDPDAGVRCGGCGRKVDPTEERCSECGFPDGAAMVERGWVEGNPAAYLRHASERLDRANREADKGLSHDATILRAAAAIVEGLDG